MPEEGLLTVYVTHVRREGTITVAYGTDEAGERVLFADDGRTMADIEARLADEDGPVPAYVEPWQLVAGGGNA